MKNLCLTLLLLITANVFSQKTFIDQPYIDTSATIDTLITPDRIYLNILLSEKDTKGKISLEELESKMISKLSAIGIDTKKQLSLTDLSSNFRKYFLKRQDIQKTKLYSLLVYDAKTVGKVALELEQENISNVSIDKLEYSLIEKLKLELKTLAIQKAEQNAIALIKSTNQKVGSLIFISDMQPIYTGLAGSAAGIRIRGSSSVSGYESYEMPDVEFEKIKVTSSVNVKYKLE